MQSGIAQCTVAYEHVRKKRIVVSSAKLISTYLFVENREQRSLFFSEGECSSVSRQARRALGGCGSRCHCFHGGPLLLLLLYFCLVFLGESGDSRELEGGKEKKLHLRFVGCEFSVAFQPQTCLERDVMEGMELI